MLDTSLDWVFYSHACRTDGYPSIVVTIDTVHEVGRFPQLSSIIIDNCTCTCTCRLVDIGKQNLSMLIIMQHFC